MDEVTHPAIVGIDVSRDWLDIYCLPGGQGLRLPNTSQGHARLVELAQAVGGGRRLLRHVMFQAALVASHHNPALKRFADRLRAAGKPPKVVIIAVARKRVAIVNALCKTRRSWVCQDL